MIEYILALFAFLELYKAAYFFVLRRRIRGPVKLKKGAAPFFKKRGKIAALLIHGFTSSPWEMKRIGNFLSKHNITVYAPLLPGHGTSPERLALMKYVQWVEYIGEQIKMLEKDYDEIYLIGSSFGGNLALITATPYSHNYNFYQKKNLLQYLIQYQI